MRHLMAYAMLGAFVLGACDTPPEAPVPEGSIPDTGVDAATLDGPRREAGGGGGDAAACPSPVLASGTRSYTISFGGATRDYDLHVPTSYKGTSPVPLVLDFHGFTSDKSQQQWISGFVKKSDSAGFVVAFPNGSGTPRSWNAGDTCCGQAQSQKLDDVGLVRAIVKQIASKVCVDPKRVYATGISNGGMLSHRLACEASDLFAATAPVAGRIDFNPMTKCAPSRPVALIHFHGLNDLLVPYSSSATPSFARWAAIDGCTDTAQTTYTKGTSKCETHSACKSGVKVTLCSIQGGHLLYLNTDSVPVADLAWDFLKGFTLP